MNPNDSSRLIDEDELRAAVRFFNFDHDSFDRGVQQRVASGVQTQPVVSASDPHVLDRERDPGGLLRVAASVVPFHLLGGSGSVPQSTAMAIGGLKKVFAFVAIPAMSLLMVVVTIGSLIRIRKAQASENHTDADVVQMEQAVNAWWRKHGWFAGMVFVFALASPMLGWTSALLVVFIVSSIATASLLVALGKAGLVSRQAVACYSIPVLGLLGQISMTFGISNHTSLLDPILVSATFFAGVGILALFVRPVWAEGESKSRQGLVWRIVFPLFCFALVLFGAKTLWNPITTASMVRYVENFEPDMVGRWNTWAVTADWLDDQNIEFDRAGVRSRFIETVDAQEHKRYLYGVGVSTGLIRPGELIEDEDVVANRERLLDTRMIGRPISALRQLTFVINTLLDTNCLSSSEKDQLVERLMTTWNDLENHFKGGYVLEDADAITRLLVDLDQSPAFLKRKSDVRRWLGAYQVTDPKIFSPSGGFKLFLSLDASHPTATEAAVRLMQHYGVSEGVDVLALRSYLRPKMDFGLMRDTEMMKASTLARLDQVPGISQPTAWDYFVRDQSLWFAIVLVGLCLYATLASPSKSLATTSATTPFHRLG